LNHIKRLPHFNSGVFYFEREDSADIFRVARSVYERRAELGFVSFKGAPIADEPAFGVAMEHCGIQMDPWDGLNGMETAIGMRRGHSLNVLKGLSRFLKDGRERTPVLIHFNVDAQNGVVYHRELTRLFNENRSRAVTASAANS
jgi:hypothetical protein